MVGRIRWSPVAEQTLHGPLVRLALVQLVRPPRPGLWNSTRAGRVEFSVESFVAPSLRTRLGGGAAVAPVVPPESTDTVGHEARFPNRRGLWSPRPPEQKIRGAIAVDIRVIEDVGGGAVAFLGGDRVVHLQMDE